MNPINIALILCVFTVATTSCKKDTIETSSLSSKSSTHEKSCLLTTDETDNEPVPLKGTVKNQQSTPLLGAKVYLNTRNGSTITLIDSTMTDGDGHFQFNAVYFGDYRVAIVAIGYTAKNVDCSMPLIADELDLGDIILE